MSNISVALAGHTLRMRAVARELAHRRRRKYEFIVPPNPNPLGRQCKVLDRQQNFTDLGIQFDIYHRTSDPLHHETAREFFSNLEAKGDLETKTTEQYFDESANTFLADRYIKGTCPNCSHPEAYGDQCEKCGKLNLYKAWN